MCIFFVVTKVDFTELTNNGVIFPTTSTETCQTDLDVTFRILYNSVLIFFTSTSQ